MLFGGPSLPPVRPWGLTCLGEDTASETWLGVSVSCSPQGAGSSGPRHQHDRSDQTLAAGSLPLVHPTPYDRVASMFGHPVGPQQRGPSEVTRGHPSQRLPRGSRFPKVKAAPRLRRWASQPHRIPGPPEHQGPSMALRRHHAPGGAARAPSAWEDTLVRGLSDKSQLGLFAKLSGTESLARTPFCLSRSPHPGTSPGPASTRPHPGHTWTHPPAQAQEGARLAGDGHAPAPPATARAETTAWTNRALAEHVGPGERMGWTPDSKRSPRFRVGRAPHPGMKPRPRREGGNEAISSANAVSSVIKMKKRPGCRGGLLTAEARPPESRQTPTLTMITVINEKRS